MQMSLRELFQQARSGAHGPWVGDAMGWVFLLLVLILASIPVYLLMRRFGWGPGGNVPLDTSWEASRARERFQDDLDQIESGIITFYRYFLYVLILLVTGAVIFLFRQLGSDLNQNPMKLYLGIAYLLFVGWAGFELRRLRWRRRLLNRNRQGRATGWQGGTVAAVIIGSILAISAVSTMILWFRK
jgi:hypothetical protein